MLRNPTADEEGRKVMCEVVAVVYEKIVRLGSVNLLEGFEVLKNYVHRKRCLAHGEDFHGSSVMSGRWITRLDALAEEILHPSEDESCMVDSIDLLP